MAVRRSSKQTEEQLELVSVKEIEPVPEVIEVAPVEEPVKAKQEEEVFVKESVLQSLTKEIAAKPELALEFIQTLGKITKPWEPMGSDTGLGTVNEVPVPPGKSAKEFLKSSAGSFVSGYRLTTIFGDVVATIIKDNPKWKITIEGEFQVDAPFVNHGAKAEQNAKEFAEKKLMERGYVIGK